MNNNPLAGIMGLLLLSAIAVWIRQKVIAVK
ncbi:MAG: LPXTG cell wall anchor domain-containing protein [Microcoleaceae cyanobacterium]